MRQHRLFVLVWVVTSILAGCDKDDNPPRIISFTPRTGSNGEILTTDQRRGDQNSPLIKAQFNEPLLASSIPADALILRYNGTVLPGISDFASLINTVSFEPAEQLLFMRKYDVTLKPGIADLKGNRDTKGKEWSFRVRDGSFSSTIVLESNTGTASDPQISIGAGFHSQMVWTQVSDVDHDSDTTTAPVQRTSIWARALKINILEPGVLVETANTRLDANSPQVAVDAEGDATAVWSQFDGTNWRIHANRFTPPPDPTEQAPNPVGTWETASTIISNAGSDATVPQIAVGPDDNPIAVWVQADDRVYAGRYTGTWGSAIAIDGNTGTPTAPHIVIDGDNNAIAVWVQNNRIYANRYTAGTGTWGTASVIDDGSGTAAAPQIAVDGDGNDAIVVWSQSDGTRSNIWANRFTANAWAGPAVIETNDGDANTPEIAMNAAGDAVAAWSQFADADGDAAEVVTISIAAPGVVSWTAHGLANDRGVVLKTTGVLPTGLTAGTTYYVRNATENSFELSATPGGASIDTSGTQSGIHTAVVPRFRIYVSQFTGGAWQTPGIIDAFDPVVYVPEVSKAGISTEPEIIIDGDGNMIAVWILEIANETEPDGEDQVIRLAAVNRYRGPVAQEELRGWADPAIFDGGAATLGDYRNPKIAVFPDFTAITVWEKDNDQDVTQIQSNYFF